MTTHPTPPTDPGSPAALPVPTAVPCADCGTTAGYIPSDHIRPLRARGLCKQCWSRHYHAGTLDAFHRPHASPYERFAGFPEGYTPTLRAYPGQPALSVPLHPFPMPVNRWAAATWAWSPDDPRLIGNLSEMLLDRDAQQEAA